jgi:hypothetical protein
MPDRHPQRPEVPLAEAPPVPPVPLVAPAALLPPVVPGIEPLALPVVLFDMLSAGELPLVPEGFAVPGPEVVPVPAAPMVVLVPLYDVRVVDWQPAAKAATSARLSTVRGRTVV